MVLYKENRAEKSQVLGPDIPWEWIPALYLLAVILGKLLNFSKPWFLNL